jgi:hypothetical protein
MMPTTHVAALQVSGIMMNEYTGKDVTTRLHEEQWLDKLVASAG